MIKFKNKLYKGLDCVLFVFRSKQRHKRIIINMLLSRWLYNYLSVSNINIGMWMFYGL